MKTIVFRLVGLFSVLLLGLAMLLTSASSHPASAHSLHTARPAVTCTATAITPFTFYGGVIGSGYIDCNTVPDGGDGPYIVVFVTLTGPGGASANDTFICYYATHCYGSVTASYQPGTWTVEVSGYPANNNVQASANL